MWNKHPSANIQTANQVKDILNQVSYGSFSPGWKVNGSWLLNSKFIGFHIFTGSWVLLWRAWTKRKTVGGFCFWKNAKCMCFHICIRIYFMTSGIQKGIVFPKVVFSESYFRPVSSNSCILFTCRNNFTVPLDILLFIVQKGSQKFEDSQDSLNIS